MLPIILKVNLKIYKKHIAIFFVLLFIVSQINHGLHNILEPHSHSHCTHSLIDEDNTDLAVNISDKKDVIYNGFHDCLLCQQHQSLKFYNADSFQFKPKKTITNTYKGFTYIKPLLTSYLLRSTSLRAPPAAC